MAEMTPLGSVRRNMLPRKVSAMQLQYIAIVTLVLLYPMAFVVCSEDCTFEDGPCNDWVSTDCNKGACFVVTKVAAMKNGPALDHTVTSEDGSCAYSTKGVAAHGTPYALISRNATAPLCFTAWYHQSGTEHEGAHFSVMKAGDYSPETFYESQREMAGRWQRVKYSERREDAVVIQITHRVKDMPEKSTFAVDDLTVESGPCVPEPKDGSCDFDWGDDCGYNFGAGNNSWKLEGSRRDNFKPPDHSTSTVLGGVAYLGAQGDLTRASFTSPLLKGRKEVQCLRFYYYIPWSLSTPENTYSLSAAIRAKSQMVELLWSRTTKRLVRGEWTAVDVAFRQDSDFKIQFSCTLKPEGLMAKPYCAIDSIRLDKCTGRRSMLDRHCNFENGWCSWQNRYLPGPNVVSWLMGGDRLKTTLPRPPRDHTFGNGTGSYLFASNFERKKGDEAHLIGEILAMNSRVTQCIEFWYMISGDETTDLKVLAIDPEHEARDTSPLWFYKGGGPVTWQQGRVAALHSKRPVFIATMGVASIPAYVALDDITVKETDKCDTLPTTAETLTAAEMLSCHFLERDLCRWSYQGTSSRTWMFGPPAFATLGPPSLPDGIKGGLIHVSGSILQQNGGLMRLLSPVVGVQTEATCVSVWYHMFGARGLSLQLIISKTHPSTGSVRSESTLLRHRGRTTTDKWYNVRRTVSLDTPHNQLTFDAEIIHPVNKASIVTLGPVQVTPGPCDVLTDTNGYCDFEFDECGWNSNSGWRRQAKLYWFTEPTLDALSGPVNSAYVLTATPASSSPSGAVVTSPKWNGQKGPQCLEFWYLESTGSSYTLQVDILANETRNVVWTKPPYTGRNWMLARADIIEDNVFQVAFRANFSGSQARESLSIDDVVLRPDPCEHPADCDFVDGLCGYVNKVDGCFRWLVGSGRLESPRLHRGVPLPQGKQLTFTYLDLTTGREQDESSMLPKEINPLGLLSPFFDVADGGTELMIQYVRSGSDITAANVSVSCYDNVSAVSKVGRSLELDEASDWATAKLTLAQGTRCQLHIQVIRGSGTNGTMAIGKIKVTKSDPDNVHLRPSSDSATRCTFEAGTTCGWKQDGGSLSWVLNDPPRLIPDYPRFDHTLKAYRGRFIFASIGQNKSFGTAMLSSPDLELNATGGACLGFWLFTVHDKRAHITVLADGKFLFGSATRTNHRWNHVLVAFNVPPQKFKLQIQAHLETGLIALDDIEITAGECPLRDFCPFEPAYSCPMHQGTGSFAPWLPVTAQLVGIPDNTVKTLKGYYLYLNTTAVYSHHPVSRVFMATRQPTEGTCVTFWWKGRGVPSQLNVYRFTKEVAMRDPLLSLNTNDEEEWWNVRTVTIKSRTRWNLVFEVVAPVEERRDSGVMIDDVEFTDGECPPYEFCSFEEECLPWIVLNKEDDDSFEPQRAGSFPQLSRDHTTQTEDGYYLLYKSTGIKGNDSALVLRDTERYRCASLWYYLPAMANGVQLLVKDSPVEEGTGVWKRKQFSHPSGWTNTVRAVSGTNPNGFVALDDLLVNELPCDELGRSTQMFDCGNKQTVTIEHVCDFAPDCRNAADERNCGQCDFSEGTCGWNLNWFRNGGTMAWRRERIGAVSGSPRIGADTRRNGHYLVLYSNITNSQLTGQAGILSPVIRNTNKLCTMRFWYNCVNNGSRTDVDLIMKLDPFTLPVWTLSALNKAPEQGIWNEAIIDIGRYKGGVRFEFTSSQWPQGRAMFAVDSIGYSGCALPARHSNCTDMEFNCANGACVSRHERCNYVDDCGDNSDEKGCWDHRLGCNFDTSFCDWVPSAPLDRDHDTWVLKRPGPTLSSSPTRDHTTGSPDGKFVILRSYMEATNATLFGPTLNNTENCWINFFYTVHGKSEPSLTLNVRTTKDGPWKTVWQQSEPTEFWHFVAATVEFGETAPYQVAFIGEHKASRQEGYVAIDDVTFSDTCRTYDKELPLSPAPSLPSFSCGAGEFQCGDIEECIPVAEVCDFKEHCSNGMDEARCGACDFTEDLCGMENEGRNARFGWNWTMAQMGKKNNVFPSADSRLDEGGAYAAYSLLNPDVPLGVPRAMVTPRLGEIAHSCVVSFYVYIPDGSSSILTFGVLPKSATSTASPTARSLSMLSGRVRAGRWTKTSVKTGNWNAGARFFYEAAAVGMSIDQTKYQNCHPDIQSEGWEASRDVSCDFSTPLDCGWFPERSAANLRWVHYSGGSGTPRLRWQPAEGATGNGAYMYARNMFFTEKIAHLVSIRMSQTPESGRCFTFWYNMWHPNVGRLNLLQRADDASSLLWTRSGPQGKAWQRAQVQVITDDPHQLVFEAILNPQNPGMIAIDNFELKDGSCDTKNVCTFESGACGWELHNWEVKKGASTMSPQVDHGTQAPAGSFALAKPPSSRMLSPPGWFDKTKGECLRFWFFIEGTVTETLNVTRVVDDQEDQLWFGRDTDAPSQRWYSAAVDLGSYQRSLSVVFQGTSSGGLGTAVALDDISLGEKACPPPGSCSFEEDMCNWHNTENLTHVQWYRHSGRTVSRSSNLENDHTLGTADGYYLLLDSEDMSQNSLGAVQSQTLNLGPAVCFRLYYHMKNGTDASLKITFSDTLGAPSGKENTVTAKGPAEWTLLTVERQDLPKRFSIIITGNTGSPSSDVAIDDIDISSGSCGTTKVVTVSPQTATPLPQDSTTQDVTTGSHSTSSLTPSVTADLSPAPKEVTEMPVTSVSSAPSSPLPSIQCERGQFNCRDGFTCIPSVLMCDGVPDCPNGLDEKCGSVNACKDNEFFCVGHTPSSCLPRYALCDGKEDCLGGADEYLCRECPSFLCLNGGVCSWTMRERYPLCHCPDGYEGRRCHINVKADMMNKPQELTDVGSNGPIVTGILVVLAFVLIGAVVVVAVLRRRRTRKLNAPMFIANPSYNAPAEDTYISSRE